AVLGVAVRPFLGEEGLDVGAGDLPQLEMAERGQHVVVEPLGVALDRAGFFVVPDRLEPLPRVVAEPDLPVDGGGNLLAQGLEQLGGVLVSLFFRREERPPALTGGIPIVDLPEPAALAEADLDRRLDHHPVASARIEGGSYRVRLTARLPV